MRCRRCAYELSDEWLCCPSCSLPRERASDGLDNTAIDRIFERMMNGPSATTPNKAKKVSAAQYRSGVRAQVFEVIVRQALAGAPWRQVCAGPMEINGITPDEVEREVRRRRGGDGGSESGAPKRPKRPDGYGAALAEDASSTLNQIAAGLAQSVKALPLDNPVRDKLLTMLEELEGVIADIRTIGRDAMPSPSAQLAQDLQRELLRNAKPLKDKDDKRPHHITGRRSEL